MMGTNGVRLHGENPAKILVSHNETGENLNMINNFAEEQTDANLAGMTPVIEDRIAEDPFLAPQQLMWRNDDLEEVAEILRDMDGPVVDLQDVMRKPVAPEFLLPDGLHPNLEGQQAIAVALVERLAEGRGR